LFLFVLSLFREEIRRFLSVPPRKARHWWNSGMLDGYQSELDILKRTHNNPYELLVFAMAEVGKDARMSIFYIAASALIQGLLELSHARNEDRYFFALLFFCMVPTFIAGALMRVGFLVKRLKAYDERVAFLEAKIAKYKSGR
jgi:hypothetical protein